MNQQQSFGNIQGIPMPTNPQGNQPQNITINPMGMQQGQMGQPQNIMNPMGAQMGNQMQTPQNVMGGQISPNHMGAMGMQQGQISPNHMGSQMNPTNDILPPSHAGVSEMIKRVREKENLLRELDRKCRENEQLLVALQKEHADTQGWNPTLVPEIVQKNNDLMTYEMWLTPAKIELKAQGVTIDECYNYIMQQQKPAPQPSPQRTPQNPPAQTPTPQGQPGQQQFPTPQQGQQTPHNQPQQVQPGQQQFPTPQQGQPQFPMQQQGQQGQQQFPMQQQGQQGQQQFPMQQSMTNVNPPFGGSFRPSGSVAGNQSSNPIQQQNGNPQPENPPVIQINVSANQVKPTAPEVKEVPSDTPTNPVAPTPAKPITVTPEQQPVQQVQQQAPITITLSKVNTPGQVTVSTSQKNVPSISQLAQPVEMSVRELPPGAQATPAQPIVLNPSQPNKNPNPNQTFTKGEFQFIPLK